MDVHTHTHTERKKFTHYLWEFLMLFLAVFCGFLAEYQLEHKIEKERSRQYVFLFYEDLKKDTAAFSVVIQSYEIKLSAFKDRKSCYQSVMKNKKSDTCLISLFSHSEKFNDLVFTDGTIQQLKNAGGLRLLDKDVARRILDYDNLLRTYIKHESTGFQDVQNNLRSVIQTLTNYNFLASPAANSSVPFLFSANPELINKYFILLESYVIRCNWNAEDMKSIKSKAIDLIEFLKEKYHLK